MTITNGYCTLAQVKARLGIGTADTNDDTALELVVQAASRWIDHDTGRRFHSTANDETRYYTHDGGDVFLCPDDILSITTLATDDDGDRDYDDTWAATDFDLEPFNAVVDSQPYTRVRPTPDGNYAFPTTRKGVKLVGKFGYATAAPDAVREACLLLAARLFKRKDAQFGVFGSVQTGMIRITDFDVDAWRLLLPFVRLEVSGV